MTHRRRLSKAALGTLWEVQKKKKHAVSLWMTELETGGQILDMHSQCDRCLSHRCIGQEVPCDRFHPENQHNDRREETDVQQSPAGNEKDLRYLCCFKVEVHLRIKTYGLLLNEGALRVHLHSVEMCLGQPQAREGQQGTHVRADRSQTQFHCELSHWDSSRKALEKKSLISRDANDRLIN